MASARASSKSPMHENRHIYTAPQTNKPLQAFNRRITATASHSQPRLGAHVLHRFFTTPLTHLSLPPPRQTSTPHTQHMKNILQDKKASIKQKLKPGSVEKPLGMADDSADPAPEPFAYANQGGLYRPTPIPNDTSSMSRGVSSQSSMASIGEEPTTDEGSDAGSLLAAPSLHRPTPMPAAAGTSSADRSRRGSQPAQGLPPLVEDDAGMEEVTPGVPLLVHTRSVEGRTRSPSPDLRRVSPKVCSQVGLCCC